MKNYRKIILMYLSFIFIICLCLCICANEKAIIEDISQNNLIKYKNTVDYDNLAFFSSLKMCNNQYIFHINESAKWSNLTNNNEIYKNSK
ncbi:MAG: hypothetical protein RR307_04140, partial [Clostridia bacterium]